MTAITPRANINLAIQSCRFGMAGTSGHVMDTHRLKYFLQVAEEGSVTRAANVAGIAQPALSRQIRLLEEDLGVTLFRRTSRGVVLTEEGERLRSATAVPLRQLERAITYAGSPLARIERGLFLGLPATAAEVLSVPLLGSLSSAFPRVTFHVAVANTDQLLGDLLKGSVDLAIMNPVTDDRIFYSDLLAEELFVVGGLSSTLDPARPVLFSELADHPLVLPSSQTGIGNTLSNTALRHEMRLRAKFVTDSLDVTKELIVAGHGYGILPLSACRGEVEAGRLIYAPLVAPVLTQQLGMAATAHLELPRGLAIKIGEIISDEVARLISSGSWPSARAVPVRQWREEADGSLRPHPPQ
ncbi:UNVERIFIED_CONTAM: DNA-binding transcriptional LysR family regulator [Williamsia faeni]